MTEEELEDQLKIANLTKLQIEKQIFTCLETLDTSTGGGGEGVNHVKRDWLEILNVNCDLYLFFCVKRDWGYLRET